MFSNGPKIVTTGLSLLADASDQLSYPGSGTAWTDVITGTTASLSGSISFTTDFQGSLVTSNSSSVIIFPPSTANFGTNTFTVEFAFRPSQINGQHWILSKNSGSFPNWGVFVTGSSGSGRLVAFFNISSAVSCSLSSAQGSIVTGSNYIVDVGFNPTPDLSRLYINSETAATGSANGTGSLSATSPLFFSNLNSGSNSGIVNNVFNIKAYTPKLNRGLVRQNYNAIGNRLGLPSKLWVSSVADSLLDFYPGAAAAYSLRQLSSDYDGFAIRVRRSSDNTETNIGFDNSGNLDTVTLLNFCGVGNGFVTTWYDQSGNGRDATQSTGANQPQIVSSGSVILQNGESIITFNGTSSNLNVSNFAYSKIDFFGVLSSNAKSTSRILDAKGGSFITVENGGAQLGISSVDNNGNTLTLSNRSSLLSVNSKTDNVFRGSSKLCLLNHYYTGNTAAVAIDGIQYNSVSGTSALIESNSISSIKIGCQTNNTNFHSGNFGEIIIYNSDQSSNRTGISDNINDFYSLY